MARRKYGDGSIFQRKDGRWEGRIVVGYQDNGYPKTKSVTAKTQGECKEKLEILHQYTESFKRYSKGRIAKKSASTTYGTPLLRWH